MTALKKAKALLTEMSRGEKAQLMKWIFNDLGEAAIGIEKNKDVCGGSACIVRTRIPVWLGYWLKLEILELPKLLCCNHILRYELKI